jgi:hypothetical protein
MTPAPTFTPTPTPTLTPTPTPTVTPSPLPVGIHDAGVFRLGAPASVRLQPAIPDLNGRVTVVASNGGDHADIVGVYLAFVPPGGSLNIGGCVPNGVSNLGANMLLPRDKVTINTDPSWQCANPALVDGLSWTLHAITDVHADDFASCATNQQVLSGICSSALSDDDATPQNDISIRSRPGVTALGR